MTDIKKNEYFLNVSKNVTLQIIHKSKGKSEYPPVLLVHGSGVGWVSWDIPFPGYSIMDHLAEKNIDVFAVECRGYGRSTKPNGKVVTMHTITDDLKAVIKDIQSKTGNKKICIAGHSYGGIIVMKAAVLYPEFIDRIVLIGTPFTKIHGKFEKYARVMVKMAKFIGFFKKNYVPNIHHKTIHERLDSYDDEILQWYKKLITEKYKYLPGGLFLDLSKNKDIPLVDEITVPVYILYGSNEYVVDKDDAKEFYEKLKNHKKDLSVQKGGYHLMFLEKKGNRAMAEKLYSWLIE